MIFFCLRNMEVVFVVVVVFPGKVVCPMWDLISLPDSRIGLDFQCVQLWTYLPLDWCVATSKLLICSARMEKSDGFFFFFKHSPRQFLYQICQSQNLPSSYREMIGWCLAVVCENSGRASSLRSSHPASPLSLAISCRSPSSAPPGLSFIIFQACPWSPLSNFFGRLRPGGNGLCWQAHPFVWKIKDEPVLLRGREDIKVLICGVPIFLSWLVYKGPWFRIYCGKFCKTKKPNKEKDSHCDPALGITGMNSLLCFSLTSWHDCSV